MTRFQLSGCVLAFALLLVAAAQGAEPAAKVRRVLFLGIDGCRFDALEQAEAPQLDALRADGAWSGRTLIQGERYHDSDTVSGPGWSSILTGVWADKHGVHDNSFRGSRYEEFPHFFRRLKEVRPDAVAQSFTTWAPITDKIVAGADVNQQFERDHLDYVSHDRECADAAVKALGESSPDALFVYFGQVDVAGHGYGFHPSVPQYIAAIERVDGLVGEVLAAVKARPAYADEEWLVVVTSDHGGRGTGHGGGRDVPEIMHSFLIVSGSAAARGELEEQTYLVDAPVTCLTYLGAPPREEWGLDGRPVGLK